MVPRFSMYDFFEVPKLWRILHGKITYDILHEYTGTSCYQPRTEIQFLLEGYMMGKPGDEQSDPEP